MLSGDGMWHTFGPGELPRVRMSDGPNGLRMVDGAMSSAVPATCYPTTGMLANSWDPALVYSVGVGLGKEATAMGVNLLLAPGVNIKRDPRGGRNFEYLSEDPLLAGELGKAYIAGVQATGVGACVKHFALNSQESYRMYADSVVDERALREIYLKPFEIALQAEPAAVMCAYNKFNGELCSQNRVLLTDILRGEWNYGGVVVSDWGAVRDPVAALNAGLDLVMPDSKGLFEAELAAAFDAGEITEGTVDRALSRILSMTDNVYLEPYGDFDVDSHDRLAYSAAAASLVLLRNERGYLPLTRDMKIAVVGELAETAPIQGGGSSHVSPLKQLSPLDAFSRRGIDVSYLRGYSVDPKTNAKLLKEAVDAVHDYDAMIVYVGQEAPTEGLDRSSIELPEAQNTLIHDLTAAGARVVVVVCSAGPVRMPWVNRVRSILYAGLNGQSGALAAVDALYGRINPCGKTAETFPFAQEDTGNDFGGKVVPYRESIFVGYRYYDAVEKRVLFPFGHGLSFSEITYDDFAVRRVGEAEFEAQVTLTNRSVRDAYEIVQIYVSDRTGRIMCAKKQLAAFAKVFIEGETTTRVKLRIPRSAFEFFDVRSRRFAIADGEYKIFSAASAKNIKHEVTVSVRGDFTDTIPFPESYVKPLRDGISDEDFAALLGSDIPAPPEPTKKGSYTLDNCADDIKKTFIGRILRRVILSRAKKSDAGVGRDSFIHSAMFTPFKVISTTWGDELPLKTAEAIISMANGKFFKGIKQLLSRHPEK